MNFVEVIKTFFEFTAVVLLIVGFINEKKIVAFEQKLFRAIRIHLRNRRLRKQREVAMATSLFFCEGESRDGKDSRENREDEARVSYPIDPINPIDPIDPIKR